YQLRLANVFHAGDGNLHPLICFDSRSQDEVRRVKEAGRELMEVCVRAGGSISGEHGVGLDKREFLSMIFSDGDMDAMLRVRAAFDPTGLCNPGKIIPMLRGCGEGRAVASVQSPMSKVQSLPSSVDSKRRPRDLEVGTNKVGSTHDPDSVARQLRDIVSDANISQDPFVSIAPESIDQVCEVMKRAASERWTVAPAGAATWLEVGNPMATVDLVVSTKNLNRIIEHEPADLVAFTEAGVTLRDFNLELARSGQWLPLDSPDDGRSTIGGVIATGLGGAQQFAYGAPRRHVIGMKVVLADGSLIKAGGRVVKNVAGYDLCKLFTGSYGTLGVIVEVNFKLRPVPFETCTVLVSGARKELLKTAAHVINSRLFPTAVELFSPSLAVEAGLSDEGQDHLLLLRFAGSINAVTEQTSRALDHVADGTQRRAPVVSEDAPLWQTVAALPSRFAGALVSRASVRPSDLNEFLRQLNESSDTGRSPNPLWHAGVGDGRIRMFEQLPAEANGESDGAKRIQQLRKTTDRLGGSLVLEDAPTSLKSQLDAWGGWSNSAALMSRIKRQLDPCNLLSPGRFGFESVA
ncbi:MAG TPA: FAD-linked oxidase C-terminal domain-containing protein, partial [Pyrinomonadaceae bacterium]|nr:FAD-linked oxidase C-terminal domain-containing protein [Pyrinomonadaceae bacterium]